MCPSTESKQRVRELRRELCGNTDPYAIAAEAIEQAERYRRRIEILEAGRDT